MLRIIPSFFNWLLEFRSPPLKKRNAAPVRDIASEKPLPSVPSSPPTPQELATFAEEVRRHQAGLRAYVRSLGMRAEAADDLAQDAFVVAFQRREFFTPGGDFGAWVRGIARKLVANAARRENRRQRLLSENITELLAAVEPPVPATDPEALSALRGCMANLKERHLQLIRQCYFEDLGPGAIASLEGCTANEIRQQLFRIRRALASCIETRLSPHPAT